MIPKKLEPINVSVITERDRQSLSDNRNKINELIDFLQAKEEASKGECKLCGGKYGDHGYINGTPCPKLDPPEHEDFDRLAQGLRNHVIDDVRFSGLFEYVKEYIRDNFVSKTKIKNIATQVGMRSSSKIVQLKILNRIKIEKIIYDKILESLGLGD